MPAAALYTSPLFRKSLLAALDTAKQTYILSAKHGLLSCSDLVEPYDITLKSLSRARRQLWGEDVGRQLDEIVSHRTTATMYCGEEYIAPIRASLTSNGAVIVEPLTGRSLGKRLQDLAIINREAQLRADIGRFHRMMRMLWISQDGGRAFSESNGRMSWPGRGVYFIMETPGGLTRGAMPRIVRVGTHAISAGSRTRLWDRLSTHRGTGSGGGSHRSSIFRSHVGQAIMRRDQGPVWPSTWAEGQSAPRSVRDSEAELEKVVSETIGGMRVIWLDVPDDAGPASERAYLERNAIGLLSRSNLLVPSRDEDWLGRYSRDWRICVSGLWNLNHVFTRPNEDFLDRLSSRIAAMIGPHPALSENTTPATGAATQLTFFKPWRTENAK